MNVKKILKEKSKLHVRLLRQTVDAAKSISRANRLCVAASIYTTFNRLQRLRKRLKNHNP